MMPQQTQPQPKPLASNATVDELLHGLVILGIVAASLFVKNPESRQHAGAIINTTNQVVLPLVDEMLNPQKAATPAGAEN